MRPSVNLTPQLTFTLGKWSEGDSDMGAWTFKRGEMDLENAWQKWREMDVIL